VSHSSASPGPPIPEPVQERGVTIAQHLARVTPRVWVTPALAGLIVLGFGFELSRGVSFMSPTARELLEVGGDFGPSVAEGEWWRTVSSMFLHAGLLHIAFNLWAFWQVGKFTERIFGNLPFLLIYLVSGIGGSLTSLVLHPLTVGVGASGAIFGVYGALLAFVLLHKGVLPREFLVRQRNSLFVFLGYNVVFGLTQSNIDMAAHGGGLVVGMAAGALMGRDLLRPSALAARRAGGALVICAAVLATGWAVRRRLEALPVVKAERDADLALVHLKARELEPAIRLYTDAIAEEPSAAWISNRGLAYLWQGDLALAEKDFRDADAREPTPRTKGLICEVRVHACAQPSATQVDRESAVKECSLAITLDPKNASLYAFRASVREDMNALTDALADVDEALRLDPNNELAQRMRRHILAH